MGAKNPAFKETSNTMNARHRNMGGISRRGKNCPLMQISVLGQSIIPSPSISVYYGSFGNDVTVVNNCLKLVKRKLTMAESFRDKDYTRIFFQALANTRNFIPFLPGAKNAHKSPFMLAQGKTYDLPWIQVMNFHNAFLFTPTAF